MRIRSLMVAPVVAAMAALALAGATPAAAATVTASLDCDAASSGSSTVVSGAMVQGDTLTLTVVNCNQATISRDSAITTGPTSINGASSQSLTFTAPSANPGATLLTISYTQGSGSNAVNETHTIANGSSAWSARSPVAGVVGSPYNTSGYQFTATGGSNYAVASGSLPPGLSLSTAGLLSGTPTTIGTFTFAVSATVSSQTENSGNVSVTITGPVVTKVTICHRTRATTNPYRLITVSVNSIISASGHSEHDTTRDNKVNPQTNADTGSGVFNPSFNYPSNRKWWGDIIPPFTHSGGTYAGLNWSGPTPDPTTTAATDWLQDSEFATAASASSDATWKTAVGTCIDLVSRTESTRSQGVNDPDKFFKVMVENGEDPDETRADLVEQQADTGSGPETVPATSALQTTYETTNATVRTDNPSGVTQTQADLNGTLNAITGGTPPTWNSWKFSYSTSRTGTFTDVGATTESSPTSNLQAKTTTLTGLICGTTYYYRIIGTTSAPQTYQGLLKSFTTDACGNGNSNNGNSNDGNSNNGSGNGGGGGAGGSSSSSAPTSTGPSSSNRGTSTPSRRTPPPQVPTTPPTPGTSVVIEDGRERRVRQEVPPTRNEATVDDGQGAVRFRTRLPDGTVPPPPPGGVIEVPRDRPLEITGGGFEPGTEVEVLLLDPERSLGTFPVDETGSVIGQVPLPPDMPTGTVSLQLNGYGSGLRPRSMTLAIAVSAQQRTPQAAVVQAPRAILMGRTATLTLPLRTDAGQRVTARIACQPVLRVLPAGERQGCVVKRDGRKLSVTVVSMNPIAVSVRLTAPGTDARYPYERTLRYVVR